MATAEEEQQLSSVNPLALRHNHLVLSRLCDPFRTHRLMPHDIRVLVLCRVSGSPFKEIDYKPCIMNARCGLDQRVFLELKPSIMPHHKSTTRMGMCFRTAVLKQGSTHAVGLSAHSSLAAQLAFLALKGCLALACTSCSTLGVHCRSS